jgi:spermidine synthase
MFCLGVYTLLAQMVVTRELAFLCLGNEITIGIVFSVWLVLIGAGAGLKPRNPKLVTLFLWLSLALPVVMMALRFSAGWIRPVGEYVSMGRVFAAAFLALMPICIPAGMVFPLGCEWLARRGGAGVVSRIYALEALGSFLAGAAFSFYMSDHFNVSRIIAVGMAAGCAGAAAALGRGWGKRLLLMGAAGLVLLGVTPGALSDWDWHTVQRRWEALGVVHDGRDGRPAVTLRGGVDTRYQNLALVESQGLFTLYGDGQVMASFPDEIACERAVHFVMAQKPGARRILLLGGNPAGELPVLLRYPVTEVVYVERDPAVEGMVRLASPGPVSVFDRNPRLTRILADGPRYIKQCGTTFDVVLVHAPEPVTGAINRFFTREFYEDVRAILAPGGFMHTSLEASERLEQDASKMAGSVYRTLETVFPDVKVTAGSPLHFFASGLEASLSLDRETLYQRSVSSQAFFKTFKSLYFLDADELAPDKIAFTEQRLHSSGAPVNTVMRPVSCYYTLILWSRYSNSAVGAVLGQVKRLNKAFCVFLAMFLGVCAMASVVIWRRSHPKGVARVGAWLAMAATGFAGMALELILLYAYQGLFGYVFSRMGFMVGLFMLGTVAGAWQIRRIETCGREAVRRAVALGLLMMAALAVGVGGCLVSGVPSEWLLYGAMAATGVVVGMQFVAVTRFLVVAGAGEGAAAGIVWLGDYWGSALGGLLAGVFLPVIFGLAATCLLLATLLLASFSLYLFSSPTPDPRPLTP